MDQRWIGGSMLTAGIGLFGVVAWIQSDRFAFTSGPHAAAPESIQTVIAPSKAAEPVRATEPTAAAPTAAAPVIELPAVTITGRKSAPAAPAAEPAAAPEHEPIPCSPWEEIGPVHVDDGVPSGIRRVRRLC